MPALSLSPEGRPWIALAQKLTQDDTDSRSKVRLITLEADALVDKGEIEFPDAPLGIDLVVEAEDHLLFAASTVHTDTFIAQGQANALDVRAVKALHNGRFDPFSLQLIPGPTQVGLMLKDQSGDVWRYRASLSQEENPYKIVSTAGCIALRGAMGPQKVLHLGCQSVSDTNTNSDGSSSTTYSNVTYLRMALKGDAGRDVLQQLLTEDAYLVDIALDRQKWHVLYEKDRRLVLATTEL